MTAASHFHGEIRGEAAFSRLQEVTIHPLLACNLACGYCYQDAERTTGPVTPRKSGAAWASRLARLFRRSDVRDIDVIITGGEPLLMGMAWYQEFFDALDTALLPRGKHIQYTLQSNASLPLTDEMQQLFLGRHLRFSVHYDGLIGGEALRSQERKEGIERLAAAGFPLTAIVVGTPEALDRLPETLDFFHQAGVAHYRLNPVGGEGRGRIDHNPAPRQRAVAEFLTGFHAWQCGFQPFESGIIWKFVAFCRTELGLRPRPTTVGPQACGGGEVSLTIYPDGSVYPCGFFCDLTGPAFRIDETEALSPEVAARLSRACQERSPVFEQRCPGCEALIFCEAYCALSAQRDNHESLCRAQRELVTIMRQNLPVTTAIANAFLDFREAGMTLPTPR